MYRAALDVLEAAGTRFLIGGAFAFERYTGIVRRTKDIDFFVAPGDIDAALAAFAARGWRTELTFPHWLGKAFAGEFLIDLIFGAGNGIAQVDDEWFTHAVEGRLLDRPVWLSPPEEMIWSKGFIMERERYDGADVAHLLRALGPTLDWRRLLRRYGENWRVLFAHVVLFAFIYPAERNRIPEWVVAELLKRAESEIRVPPREGLANVCRGTLLSRQQYLVDIEQWGYRDARLIPSGSMTSEDVKTWTDAIARDGSVP